MSGVAIRARMRTARLVPLLLLGLAIAIPGAPATASSRDGPAVAAKARPLDGWTPKAPYPIPIHDQACATQATPLYCFGGTTIGYTVTASAYEYSEMDNTWTRLADLPEPRAGASAVSAGSYSYILNGSDGVTGRRDTLYRYDTYNSSNTLAPASPLATSAQAAIAFNDQIHGVDGQLTSGMTSSVDRYSMLSNAWGPPGTVADPPQTIAPLPAAPRSGAGYGLLGSPSALYVVGGWDGNGWTQDNQAYIRSPAGTATSTPRPAPTETPLPTHTPVSNVTATPAVTYAPSATETPAPSATVTPTGTPTPGPCPLAWRSVPGPPDALEGTGLADVAALAANDVWAVGGGSAPWTVHWDGDAWTSVPIPGTSAPLVGLAAAASDDMWAVGDDQYETRLAHWDGSTWSFVPIYGPPPGYTWRFNDVAAANRYDAWAVGVGPADAPVVIHWDGNHWDGNTGRGVATTFWCGVSCALAAVAARASDDVWVVGSSRDGGITRPLTAQWTGSSWSVVPSPSMGGESFLQGVAAVAADDAWAVGGWWEVAPNYVERPLIEHWDGHGWAVVPGPDSVQGELSAVAAIGPDDVWATGAYYDSGAARYATLTMHWDGDAWTRVPSPNPEFSDNRLSGVAAVGPRDVWAVGTKWTTWDYQPLFAHYSDTCPPTPTPTPTPPGPTPTVCPLTFSDVHSTDYFYQPVLYLGCNGVISGYADGTFRPYNNTTRAQMVKIVVLGFGAPITTPTPTGAYTFADVPPSAPFFAVIETAAADGIISGYTCGGPGESCDAQHRPYFRPNANVTRGQLSKIDAVAAGWPLLNPPSGTFADVAPGSAFYTFVETAAARGVISGYACGGPDEPCDPSFRPYFRAGNNATRGQIAKIVYLSLTAGSGPRPAPGK